jgi:hypothetical protein
MMRVVTIRDGKGPAAAHEIGSAPMPKMHPGHVLDVKVTPPCGRPERTVESFSLDAI